MFFVRYSKAAIKCCVILNLAKNLYKSVYFQTLHCAQDDTLIKTILV